MTIKIRTTDGGMVQVSPELVQGFKNGFRGAVVGPDDREYADIRKIWNAMIDRHPALIMRCTGTADVMQAVRFARKHQFLVAVRGGGHNIAGLAISDHVVVIDLSLMRSVQVDPLAGLVRVQAGALLGDVDHECQAFGLATPLGVNSTTGIAGLTLGGGFGWLTRKYGMTVDNLVAAEVITAAGERVIANDSENPDLFWALRGGGGNFGVVTTFEFRLHRVGPEITSGLIVYPLEQAVSVLEQYREFVRTVPEDMNVWVVLRKAPPLPFLPGSTHGRNVIILAFVHLGDPGVAERAIQPLRGFGSAYGEHIGPSTYAAWQQAFDPLLAPGARNYWKSHNLASLESETIQAAVHCAGTLPTDECEIFFAVLGGAAARIPVDTMAYGARDAEFLINIHARWRSSEDDERCIGWARKTFESLGRHATGSVYVNFLTAEEIPRIGAAYGKNHARLVAVKNRYDPTNLFRLNHNITPSVQGERAP